MTTVNERIKLIVDTFFHRNGSAFAREIGIKQSTLKDIIGGRLSKPGYEIIEKILSANSLNISPEWLILGEGEMLKNFPENSENLLKQSEKEERNNSIDELINQKIENAVMENIDKTIDTILKNVKEILKDQNEGNTNNLKILIEAVIGLVKEEDKEEIKNKLIALKKKVG